jgi:EmrB/QacA subfamily drug resistance transporter
VTPPSNLPAAREGDPGIIEAPGVDEVAIAPWPRLYRLRHHLTGASAPTNRWAVLVVVLVGLFTVSVTVTLLAVSQVQIANDVHTSTSTVAWIITAPMLAFGIVGPAAGKAGDLWGHKKLFLIGLLGAGLFALATAVAWDVGSLIVFRTLSAGLGSATGPAAIAIITRSFEGDERVRALGFWSFVSAGAPVIGVVVGGPLVAAIGWRVIFLVQAPLCFLGLVVALVLLPETDRGTRSRFDVAGAALLGLGVTAFLIAMNRGGEWGWTSPAVVAGFLVAPIALAAFVAVERRVPEPLLPLGWLKRRNITGPIACQGFSNFAYMGGLILTPVLLEQGLGFTTAAVGLIIIARPLAFSITSPTFSYATIRVGERVAGVLGSLVVLASMLALARVQVGSPTGLIVLGLALSGVGLGMSSPALTAVVADAVAEADLGVAAAMQQLVAQVGSVVGVQLMQTVQAGTVTRSGYIGSFANAYYVGAVACALAAGAALLVRPTVRVLEVEPEPAIP